MLAASAMRVGRIMAITGGKVTQRFIVSLRNEKISRETDSAGSSGKRSHGCVSIAGVNT